MNPGTRLGPYEIFAPIGAGGMGEVYRARDTRLGRDVAIKVLPAAFANDADRLRRFDGILSDGHTLLVSRPGEVPEKVFRLNINTGERQLWKQIGPADRAGVDGVGPLRTYHDGNAYIYSYVRDLSELYLYKGLR
ncbi:MAG TPA: hypothetical protein VGR50_08650 [Terriglobales bacterium]|nr:hypothetical protein [Terriglobales bacterium]